MRPELMLARTNPRSCDLDCTVAGTDKMRTVTPAEIGYALAGCGDAAADLVLAKYGNGGESGIRRTRAHLMAEVSRWMSNGGGMDGIKVGVVRRLVHTAIEEIMSSGCCEKCAGRGVIYDEMAYPRTQCETCEGTGRDQWGDRERARSAKLGRHIFGRRDVREFYSSLLGRLVNWEATALCIVAERCRGDGMA